MVLTIDIGNTNIVFGVADQKEWLKIWRIQTDLFKTADEYEVIFRSLFSSSDIIESEIGGTVLSSVVPSLIRPFKEMLGHLLNHQPLLVEPSVYKKLPVEILSPDEIGADIVADATAAFIRYGGSSMVIDFGTSAYLYDHQCDRQDPRCGYCARTFDCIEIIDRKYGSVEGCATDCSTFRFG